MLQQYYVVDNEQITPPPQKTSSYNKSKRNSSVEIFRIVATLLVLVVHFNGWFVGGIPENLYIDNISSQNIGQLIIQALSCVCVNCFLVISGFYGIKLRFTSVWNLFTLLLGIYVPIYLITSIHNHNFGFHKFIDSFFVFSNDNYFVQCYLMLMFLSPMINTFVEKQKKDILFYSLALVFIEWWMECIREQTFFGFNEGYSVMHFLVMYILARTAFVYKDTIVAIKSIYWVIGYLLCTAIICLMYIFGIKYTFYYSNPVVIASSFCLFFPFLHRNFYRRWINWIAASSLAVFIIHTYGPISNVLSQFDKDALLKYNYTTYLIIMATTIIVVFAGCVMYDKIREMVTKPVSEGLISILKKNKNLNRLI